MGYNILIRRSVISRLLTVTSVASYEGEEFDEVMPSVHVLPWGVYDDDGF